MEVTIPSSKNTFGHASYTDIDSMIVFVVVHMFELGCSAALPLQLTMDEHSAVMVYIRTWWHPTWTACLLSTAPCNALPLYS